MKSKHCQWCDNSFDTNISYQIYCSAECRTEATKEKIAERYAKTRRQREKHRSRKCAGCAQPLSVYNDDTVCYACTVNPKEVKKILKEIKGISNGQIELD